MRHTSTTGQLWGDAFMSGQVNHAGLLSNIFVMIIGSAGAAILSIVIALACLTMAIGLTSSCAEFVVELLNERVDYVPATAVICVFSSSISVQ